VKNPSSGGDIACEKLGEPGTKLASRSRAEARGEISLPWEGEEEGRKGNGGWENVEMGWKELLRAGQWRADGCKRIYWERVQRYCSGSERRGERELENEERERVTLVTYAVSR